MVYTLKNLKVALITNVIAPYRRPLFEELGKNVDLTVVCSTKNKADKNWKSSKCYGNASYKHIILKGLNLNLKNDYSYIQPELFLRLYKLKPNIIITSAYGPNTFFASLFARLLGIPCILWSASTIASEKKYSNIRNLYRKILIKMQSAFIAVGSDSNDYLLSIGASIEKCYIAYNAVGDMPQSGKIASIIKKSENIKSTYSGTILLYSGQLIRRKGLDLLFSALKLVQESHNITMLIIGSGPLENALRKIANDLKLQNVIFLGFKQDEDLMSYYFASDVYVLPTREDTWAMVINEAMQCGLPVVCSKYAGCVTDLVHDKITGLIIDPYDKKNFALTLNEIISNNEQRDKLKVEAQKRISKFSIKSSTNIFIQAIKSCI